MRYASARATVVFVLTMGVRAFAADDDIRDIRGPKVLDAEWLLPLLAAGILSFLLICLGVWLWRRRRHERVLLPFELALKRLDDICPLMTPSSAREFCIAASDIVRGYIEQRFAVTATQRTTEEFLQDLLGTSNAGLSRHRALLAEFLERCDFVKFAGVSIAVSSMESLRQSARSFVSETAKPDDVRDPLPAT